jgi:hypothetical protein
MTNRDVRMDCRERTDVHPPLRRPSLVVPSPQGIGDEFSATGQHREPTIVPRRVLGAIVGMVFRVRQMAPNPSEGVSRSGSRMA